MEQKLILNRLNDVYCRLAPSTVHGVGIFAIREIPKGINPFRGSYMAQDSILVKKSAIKNDSILKMLDDYHPNGVREPGGTCGSLREPNDLQIVSKFPNQLIWTNYLNYSSSPNIELMPNGEWTTLRIISVSEELLEDPKRLFNADGTRKVFRVTTNQYPFIKYL